MILPRLFFAIVIVASAAASIYFDVSRTVAPITNVTVFVDRAEVTRALSLSSLKELMKNEDDPHDIVLRGLPMALDPDSVRVRILDSRIKLLELSWVEATPQPTNDDDDSDERRTTAAKRASLEHSIEEKVTEINLDKQALHRLRMQLTFIEGYARSVTGTPSANVNSHSADSPLSVSMDVQTVEKVVDLYTSRAVAVDAAKNVAAERLRNRERALATLRAQLGSLDQRLNTQKTNHHPHSAPVSSSLSTRAVYDVTLTVEFTADPTTPATTTADDDTSPVVLLVYMVHGASWSPSYDIRVAEESDFLSLTYFGRIQQHTGEDWDQCAVKLSTATPSVGGRPPSIGTKTVRYRRPTFYHHHNNNNFNQQQHQGRHRRKSMKMMSRGATAASGRPSSVASAAYGAPMPPQAQRMFAAGDSMVGGDPLFTNAAESIEVEVDSDGVEHEGGGGVGVATASVEAGATSAAFMIERLTTITGDNKQRKVTIALIPMKTVATFYAVPSLEPKAYYRARATVSGMLRVMMHEMNIEKTLKNHSLLAHTYISLPPPPFSLSLSEPV